MKYSVVIGSGGHCRAVLSILKSDKTRKIKGIIDLEKHTHGEIIMGIPVIGSVEYLQNLPTDSVDIFLAIGSNSLRSVWWEKIKELGFMLPNLISPFAYIDPTSSLGEGNVICANSFIGPEARLGKNNLINTSAVIEHEVEIGSHCHLAPSSTIAGRSLIGDKCFFGAGAIVINGITIVSETVVGAGATVIKNISRPGIYVGIPSRLKEG